MTFLTSLLSWANVPFVIALGVAVAFALLQVSGLLGLLAGGGDHDGDADADADGDADGHDAGDTDGDADGHDADGDADHDADGDNDHDGDQDQDQAGSAGKDLLAGMGVGTMPLSIVWQSFAVCFALGGITANTIYFTQTRALPVVALAWSVPAALVFAYGATRLISKAFARLAPNPGKTSTSRKDLVGKVGVVISSKINEEFGEVRITDATGNVLRVICRTLPGEEPVVEGREVVFVEYDREKDLLFVAAFDVDAPRKRPRLRLSAEALAGGDAAAGRPPPEAAHEEAPSDGERSKMTS